MEEAIVTVYDPIAMPKVEKLYGDKIHYATSAEKALENSEVAFILTEWDEIKHLSLEKIKARMAQPSCSMVETVFHLKMLKNMAFNIFPLVDQT